MGELTTLWLIFAILHWRMDFVTGVNTRGLRGQKPIVRKAIGTRVVITSVKLLSEHALKLSSKSICVCL